MLNADQRRRTMTEDPKGSVKGLEPPSKKRKARSISDGNHDGNDGSHQRPDAAVNGHVLSHIQAELGIRYT
jgi:hypothetical protein